MITWPLFTGYWIENLIVGYHTHTSQHSPPFLYLSYNNLPVRHTCTLKNIIASMHHVCIYISTNENIKHIFIFWDFFTLLSSLEGEKRLTTIIRNTMCCNEQQKHAAYLSTQAEIFESERIRPFFLLWSCSFVLNIVIHQDYSAILLFTTFTYIIILLHQQCKNT